MFSKAPVVLAAGLMCATILPLAAADQGAAATSGPIPGLSWSDHGWFPVGDDFLPPLSGPGPVVSDPAHPYYNNQSGKQPTDRVADLSNPILKPAIAARLRKSLAADLAKLDTAPRARSRKKVA